MIVPMYKYAFLIYHRDFDEFLSKIQELGMVDIVRQSRQLTEHERLLMAHINKFTTVSRELKSRINPELSDEVIDPYSIVSEYDNLLREREQLENLVRKSQKELADVRPWGNFDISLIKLLANNGLRLRFFVIVEKSFDESWLNEYPIEIIHREAGQIFFVVIQDSDVTIPSEATEVKAPTHSANEKEHEISSLKEKIGRVDLRINQLAGSVDILDQEKAKLMNQLEFVSVKQSADKEAEDTLIVLHGWVPENKNSQFAEFVEKESVIYMSERAQKSDNAPILLKNSKFAKLFEPIGSLFTTPTYGELDLTPFFAPFFMMFFGFCMGDAGYGLVMFIGATIYKFKAKKEFKPILSLVQWFSVSTVFFGTITGTIFGVDLIKAQIPMLDSFKDYFLGQKQLFALALAIGGLQIVFGMFVKVANLVKLWGWKYAISTMGWILLIVGSVVFYGLSKVTSLGIKLMGTEHLVLLGVAGVGIFFFNSPGKNPFLNFGIGLWDSYSMITGLFGDILSYIRLFALGLSSAILGNVFNSLAFGMAPDVPILGAIVTIIILLIGHSINIFMSALGSLVHPMRLTFVEFYKNAGFVGGGKIYQPFQKQ